MKIKLHKSLPQIFLFSSMLFGLNEAMAYSSVGNTVEQICANAGNPILVEFQSNLSSDCYACHNDGDGGSGAGKTASRGSDTTIINFFCPEPIAQGPICTDADNDGYFAEGLDCGTFADFNDNNASAYPGAAENCSDGIDNDGNGQTDGQDTACMIATVCNDLDGDTYSTDGGSCGPIDCNDYDAAINPGAEENCSDNIDNNCNGRIDTADMNAVNCPIACSDLDGDGYSIEGGACGSMDCDDTNGAVNPAALEICDDGIDNNCNNLTDSSDNVCQTNNTGDNDDEDKKPWWRTRKSDRDDKVRLTRRSYHDDKQDSKRSRSRGERDDD